jgi:hypothetical protein
MCSDSPWHGSCPQRNDVSSRSPSGAELRRSPRIDVLRRVKGELVSFGAPLTIYNISRTGFAATCDIQFDPGDTLDFRLVTEDGFTIRVTAEAVHHRPVPNAPGKRLTGFRFVRGRLLGVEPQALIDQLIEALTPAGSLL